MAVEFRFPDVGEGITEGHLIKWLVKEGERVKADQPLAEIETDKAVVELPAPAAGNVQKLHAKAGATIKVGELLITIGGKGEKAAPVKGKAAKAAAVGKAAKPKAAPKGKRVSTSVVGELPTETVEIRRLGAGAAKAPGKVLALPAVRKLARDLGVNIASVKGTGTGGRVTEQDVKRAAAVKPAAAVAEMEIPTGESKITFNKYGRVLWVPITPTRKAIIKRLVQSQAVPTACGMRDADITDLAEVREDQKGEAKNKGIHLTFLPFIVRAVVAALKKHPYVNSELDLENGVMVNKNYYNIGIAVETSHGLMVPVVKNADSKSIMDVAHDIEVLADGARKRTLALEDMRGGTFSITNYGSIGGNYAVPMLNYPEVAILGVGRAEDKPVVKDGEIIARKILPLSLTFDHRVVDGAQAAEFLKDVVRHLENPNLLLVDID